ncbi:MAG: hypothetical protein O3B46_03730 [Bacteroidetes bacterium]|nr:hypothetical protein [Bacteroidota bacterium]
MSDHNIQVLDPNSIRQTKFNIKVYSGMILKWILSKSYHFIVHLIHIMV